MTGARLLTVALQEAGVDTIFALSSGSPPAAIAVVRVNGPLAGPALAQLSRGRAEPAPRRAVMRTLTVPRGTVLDQALILWFPGPATASLGVPGRPWSAEGAAPRRRKVSVAA